ncbi:MAG: hypothetical protein Q8Q03_00810 [bacterium]|nr:hypothetical protein [bacterium]
MPENKKEKVGAFCPGVVTPNKIQPLTHIMTMGGGTDGRMHTYVSVVNVNRNDGQWNVNVNRLDNDNRWNVENRVFVRNYIFLPSAMAEVLFSIYFFQPESILPISMSFSNKTIYFLSAIILDSQHTVRKNFARSFFMSAFPIKPDFSSELA